MTQAKSTKLRMATVLVPSLSAIAFLGGLFLGAIPGLFPNKQPWLLEKIGFGLICTPAIVIATVKGINGLISQEIEQDIDEKRVELSRELERKISKESNEATDSKIVKFCTRYKKEIEALEIEISSLAIDVNRRKIILEKLRGITFLDEKFLDYAEGSQRITEWLADQGSRLSLSKEVVEEVEQSHGNIPEKYLAAFTNDVRARISWMRHSISLWGACEVNPIEDTEKFFSAVIHSDMPYEPKLYQTTLMVIKNRILQVGTPGFSESVEDLAKYLDGELVIQSKKFPQKGIE